MFLGNTTFEATGSCRPGFRVPLTFEAHREKLSLLAEWITVSFSSMSKAFTRESDDVPDVPVRMHSPSALPPGAKNYLTPDGERRLREELSRLVQIERPRV